MNILALLRNRINKTRTLLRKSRYTPYTYAEYLRSLGAQIGDGCFIGNFELDVGIEPYLISIGNHVAIASCASLMTHDGACWIFRHEYPSLQVYGPVIIEDNCFIGYSAIVCPNVRIGRNSVVAAGSLVLSDVVLSDVPANTLVMGVPARAFGSIDRYREKCVQRWAMQCPPNTKLDPGETWWTSRHLEQNRELLRKHLIKLFEHPLSDHTIDPAPQGEKTCASASG
jgi:acetyltransferase-like isoleucine patch superfamily enzyme